MLKLTLAALAVAATLGLGTAQAGQLLFNTEDLPPFNYVGEGGAVAGPSKELIAAACAKMGESC